MSEDIPDRMPNKMSECVSDRLSEFMPDRMPNSMAEYVLDRLSCQIELIEWQIERQNMCQVDCQNMCQTECQIERKNSYVR